MSSGNEGLPKFPVKGEDAEADIVANIRLAIGRRSPLLSYFTESYL